MEKYDITDDMLDNCAVTFSMIDTETGLYKIANVAASLLVREDRPTFPDETKYTLAYHFKLKDTKKAGNYLANFKITFLGENCGIITMPVDCDINVFIQNSSTKVTLV
ncbi:MAG: hypothetical protein HC836_41005 [Richelia sp. RM2_1_2]|nr:hypothetical protein [Richelia sp. RM2_1_2]